jgi:hypothetical protein
MTIATTIRLAAAGLIATAALSPVALAGGEPKNDWPFTRNVADRTLAAEQSQLLIGLGEPKNQFPFTRPVADRTVSGATNVATALRPDDRAGIRGVGADVTSQPSTSLRPDDRPGIRGVGADIASQPSTALRPDDRPGPLGVGEPTYVPVSGGTAFHWGDWAIGLVAGIGIALGMAGALLLVSRRGLGKIGAAATR